MMKLTLQNVVKTMVLRQGYNAGQSPKELAKVSGLSYREVLRRLHNSGVAKLRR